MSEPDRPSPSRPWTFVPALYFLQGIPNSLVETAITVFLAAIGVPKSEIGHAWGFLRLPWILKPVWSPFVDLHATKRVWILAMQTVLLGSIASLAFAVTRSDAVLWTIVACGGTALFSSTHDIAADGFYLLALDPHHQAAFVGIRNTFFRLGRIFVMGGIVKVAGKLTDHGRSVHEAWAMAFGAAAAAFAIGLGWCMFALPRPSADRSEGAAARAPFLEALVSYFRQPGIGPILAFILLYRFGESMLTPMLPSFLIDPASEGGMGLSTDDLADLWGTIGVVALIAGGILGGVVIARHGLRRWLWPMALSMHLPNLLYVWAAFEHPGRVALAAIIAVEQFAYGFGFSAYMVFLMHVSQGRGFPTTHYAISTGIMGLGAMAAGFASGDIASALGFGPFFVVVCLAAIPGLVPILFIPLEERGKGS